MGSLFILFVPLYLRIKMDLSASLYKRKYYEIVAEQWSRYSPLFYLRSMRLCYETGEGNYSITHIRIKKDSILNCNHQLREGHG